MKRTRCINGLSEKIIFQDKWAILEPKIVHPHNSGSTLWIFKIFCTMKGSQRYMNIILIVFLKKILFIASGPFCTWKLWICSKIFLNFPQYSKRGEKEKSTICNFGKCSQIFIFILLCLIFSYFSILFIYVINCKIASSIYNIFDF